MNEANALKSVNPETEMSGNTEPSEYAGVETTFANRMEFKGAVIGMVLGDGTLVPDGKNSRLQMHHSHAQREYLEWKLSVCRSLTATHCYQTSTGAMGQTRRHPFYTALRERMYASGRKSVDAHVLRVISPMGLAIWYMDDGCLCHSDRWADDYCVQLYTNNFSRPENEMIQYWMKRRFGVDFSLYHVKNRKGELAWFLSLRNTRAFRKIDHLFSIIRPWVHPSMQYKLAITERPAEHGGNDIVRTSAKAEGCQETVSVT